MAKESTYPFTGRPREKGGAVRILLASACLMAAGLAPAQAQQSLGFQAGTAPMGAAGQPLNLLSPTFVAPAASAGALREGRTAPQAVVPETGRIGLMTAPLPAPRPASAPPRPVLAQQSPPVPSASVAVPAQPATATVAQGAPQEAAQEAAAAQPSAEPWPDEEDRGRVIIAGAYRRPAPAPASAIAAIAAAAPQQPAADGPALPAQAVAFRAPVPLERPGATTVVPVSAAPAAMAAPVLASASSVPVTLASRGTATTMVVPAAPIGSLPGAQQAAIVTPTPARGPVLAALPPDGASRDWPRYLPGARGEERNLGIAGERVTPDPGVPLSCLPAPVRRALNDVALRFGPVLVRSTHRGNGRFVRVDAWRGSYHRDCRAADFRVSGEPSAVLAFLRAKHDLGGVKRYRNGLFHIDNGPRRSW